MFSYKSGSNSQWKKEINLTEFLDSLEVFRSKLPTLPYFLSEYMWLLIVSKNSEKKGQRF